MICDNLNVHIRTNKRYEERAVFLDISYTGFCSKMAYIGYFWYSNLTFILLITIDVRGSMKLVKLNKFMVN